MSYDKNVPEATAVLRSAEDVDQVTFRSGTVARFIAPGSATEGRFGLFQWNMGPRAGGPGPHFHKTFSESFYVISGTVRLYDGSRWTDARSGDFLYVPEGGIHGFGNESNEPASMLILFAPGASREQYFRELAEISISERTLTDQEWTKLYARHDQYQADLRRR